MGVLGSHVVTPSEHLYPHFTDKETVTCDCPWAIFGAEGPLPPGLNQVLFLAMPFFPQRNPRRLRQRQEAGAWAPSPSGSQRLPCTGPQANPSPGHIPE